MYARTIITMLTALTTILSGQGEEKTAQAANEPDNGSLGKELQEIVVTAKQPATRLSGTTLVSTIVGSSLADLGNALDVLAQLPMINVQDNNVSVTGRDDIEIFIDGRPMRDPQELQQLLSSNIKKVELLLAPGAAYESTTDAVLRITTRRNFVEGLSLTDQLQLQCRRKWSVTDFLAFNYRSGNLDFFLEGSFNHNNSLRKGTTTNTLIYNEKETVIGSSQSNSYPTDAGAVKGGFNLAGEKRSLGAYYRYNPERGNFLNTGTEWLDDQPPLNRHIDRTIRSHSHLVSAYYEEAFTDRCRLHLDADFRRSVGRNHTSTTYHTEAAEDVSSADSRRSTLWAARLYTVFPLGKGEFTIGTQDSYTLTTLDYRMMNADVEAYIPSSVTDTRQTSAALFATWAAMFERLSLQAGARYEYTDYDFKTDGRRDPDISRRDHLLTPDISIGYNFADDIQMTLSYRMATVKPPYSQLTGALDYVGMHEIEGGNPGLRDEKTHDLQFFGMWKGFMLQADFMRAVDTYAFVKQRYPAPGLQLLLHPINIDVSSLSLYLIWSQPVGFWTPDLTMGLYRQWFAIDSNRYEKPIFSYSLNNTIALPRGWTLTADMRGQTSGDMHTNRFAATWFTMDASIGRTFFKKALTIKLTATDIFNTANNDWTMNTYGIFVDKRQSYDRRGISLNLIYRFQPRPSKYKGSTASQAEMNRL